MSPVELDFVPFVLAAMLAYWLVPRSARAQNGVLLTASYLFFFSWQPRLLPVLILASVVDYLIAGALAASEDRGRRRMLLGASLVFNIGELLYFKYLGFFASAIGALFGAHQPTPMAAFLGTVAPLGMSFRVLQKIGYIIEVYYRRAPACRSWLAFFTWVAFFPQLIAGPISRAADYVTQFERARSPSAALFASGAADFLLGFVLKGFAAEYLAMSWVQPVFNDPAGYTVASRWLGLIAYGGQIFADFAGYSWMAIGVAKAFSITLPINFTAPYLATSLPEFWRRWHISLNQWLFTYVYAPLVSGRGAFRGREDVTMMLTFLASGLWHGASWCFVLWGAAHGVGMIVHRRWSEGYKRLCRKDRAWVTRRGAWWYRAVAWGLTTGFFVLTLVPFRAATLAESGRFLALLVGHSGQSHFGFGAGTAVQLLFACAPIAIAHAWSAGGSIQDGPARRMAARLPAPVLGAAIGLVLVFLFLFMPLGTGAFVYRNF